MPCDFFAIALPSALALSRQAGKYAPTKGTVTCTNCEAGRFRSWEKGEPQDPAEAEDCEACHGKGADAPVCPVAGMNATALCGKRAEPWRPDASGAFGNVRCRCSKRFYGYSTTAERVTQLPDNETLLSLVCTRCPEGTLCNDPGLHRTGCGRLVRSRSIAGNAITNHVAYH